MESGHIGVHLVDYGRHRVFFRPWYFDGRTVYHGEPEVTRSQAMDSAQRIKESISGQNGFINNW